MIKYLFLSATILAIAVHAFGQTAFTLTGQIKGLPDDTKLFCLKETGEMDSTVVSALNGNFSFRGRFKEPVMGVLLLESLTNLQVKNKSLLFWLDSSNIAFKSSYNNFSSATITGSLINRDAAKFNGYLNKLDSISKIAESLNTLYNEANKRSFSLPIDKREDANKEVSELAISSVKASQLLDSMKTRLVVQYMVAHPLSYPALYETYIKRGKISINTLTNIYRNLNSYLQNLNYGKLLGKYIESYKGITLGQLAPDFTLKDTNGKSISLNSYRGRYVLLEFWGSWCSPCRWENPKITELYEKYRAKGFEVLGIGMDSKDNLIRAIKQDKISWKNVVVPEGYDSQIAAIYGVWAAPYNVLISPDGKIIAIELREVSVKAQAKKLSEQLSQIFDN
jgi:peroxiredoxin